MPSEAQSTYGAYAASPVVSDGIVYMQDLESNVAAFNLETGELIWETKMEEPDQGPNGVTVEEGKVFGATATKAFALDAASGKEIWSTELTTVPKEAIDMSPGVHDGLVYVSTVPTDVTSAYNGGIAGVLWALDAKTGAKKWHWDTVPKSLWSKMHKSINAGGGLWYAPSFDEEGGMYVGTGNPVPFPGAEGLPWGASRPGPNLYTDSLVKLNAKTGKLEWYYQVDPARRLRLGLPGPADPRHRRRQAAGDRRRASRAWSSRSTRRPARSSGRRRSANTTATTKTACWRCAAKPRSCRSRRPSTRGSSAA